MTDTTHQSKWWTSMIAKHGSKAAVQEFMRAAQEKSRQNPGSRKGGFYHLKATDPEAMRKRSRDAANKRWHPNETDSPRS